MSTYALPRTAFDLLVEALGEKQKAEIFAKAIESAIEVIDDKAKEIIVEKKNQIKGELRDELRNELVTRELFDERFKMIDERFNVVDEKFKSLNFKLNIFIAIALIALTFANPTFVMLIEKIFGIK